MEEKQVEQVGTDHNAGSAAAAETPAPGAPMHPKCQHCGADPIKIRARAFQVGNAQVLVAFCAECRNPVPCSIIDIVQPQIMRPPAMPSPLVIPGR